MMNPKHSTTNTKTHLCDPSGNSFRNYYKFDLGWPRWIQFMLIFSLIYWVFCLGHCLMITLELLEFANNIYYWQPICQGADYQGVSRHLKLFDFFE